MEWLFSNEAKFICFQSKNNFDFSIFQKWKSNDFFLLSQVHLSILKGFVPIPMSIFGGMAEL